MTVEERSRGQLQEALMATIGPEQSDTLLGYLPPTGWAEVSTTRDLQALRAELRGEIGELRGEMHRELRLQFYSLATLMTALLAIAVTLSATGFFG